MINFSNFPRQQTQLVGHAENFSQLWALFEQGKISPCWLLVGPQGVGKATFSYAFARKVLSQNPQNPCGFQDTVVAHQISIGSYPNIYVLEPSADEDGKPTKEIRIDDVRKSLVFLRQSPTIPGWRVVVVDSVDMLNRFAANALLKILEEPPQKTIMLLVCHSLGKTPPTIRSRCQRLLFRPVSIDLYEKVFGEDINSQVFSLCNGSMGLYAKLMEAGGPEFLKKLESSVFSAFDKNMLLCQKFSEEYAKSPLHYESILKILCPLLHTWAVHHPQDKKYAYAYKEVLTFIKESETAHLDPFQKLLSLFLLVERASF
jgi:DNA polymerase-3 subunit delta'